PAEPFRLAPPDHRLPCTIKQVGTHWAATAGSTCCTARNGTRRGANHRRRVRRVPAARIQVNCQRPASARSLVAEKSDAIAPARTVVSAPMTVNHAHATFVRNATELTTTMPEIMPV